MTENAAPFDASSFDLITCIEVMEHVPDAHATARELARLLRPRGLVVVTAPCANRWSGPWIYNRLTGGFEPTRDGIGRFATDEPAHLRRMSSADLSAVLAAAGIRTLDTRWWGHGFTAVADSLPFVRSLPIGVRRAVASLDWRILRRFSNGGAMVTVGEMSS
jgi:SAM-dependent methyltransferase